MPHPEFSPEMGGEGRTEGREGYPSPREVGGDVPTQVRVFPYSNSGMTHVSSVGGGGSETYLRNNDQALAALYKRVKRRLIDLPSSPQIKPNAIMMPS